MENDLEEVVFNIRACVQSNKGPMSLRNLSRDYETIVSGQIPFRKFNYNSLEDFLRSLPTLRVSGSGGQATVEVQSSNESKHITSLIAKQKTVSKKFTPLPSRKSYQSTFRGRGSYRGRGRGGYPTKPFTSRDYGNFQEPTPQNDFQRDQSDVRARDYNLPKRYSPNLPQRHESDHGPITIKVDRDDDKRQVSWTRNELPPRLQRLRQKNLEPQENTLTNSHIPPAPSLSPGSQGFDSSIYLDQLKFSTNSHYGPSKLIERAKERAAKQEQSQSVLQPSNQDAISLVTDFTQLSHQDSIGHQNGNLNIQTKEPNRTPALQQEDLLPQTDEVNVINNIEILLRYCSLRGWNVPSYRVLKNPSQSHLVFAAVKVLGDSENNFTVNSLPEEHENASIVKGIAAKKALEKIRCEELKKVKVNKIISRDDKIYCRRIENIVNGCSSGLFAKSVEEKYISCYNEYLPDDWLTVVGGWPTLSVENTLHRPIILPREPTPLQQVVCPPAEEPETLVPPQLQIEALGDEDGMEDVFITSATSISNVWFRVIGPNYSEQYESLLIKMDLYYKGEGAKDLALTLEKDHYYAAHDVENDTWFRVCVTEVDEDSRTVLAWLVDLGDHERFTFGSLYKLTPQFCQLPQQAVMCALEDFDCVFENEIANEVVRNSELLIGKALIANITSKDKELGYVKAILYDTSSEDDVKVNEKLKDEIMAKAIPVLPGESCITPATIGYVSKKGEVYVTFNNPFMDSVQEICNSLPTDIGDHKLTSFKNISLNKIYLAKYHQDSNWYRAKVTTTPSLQHNMIKIQFLDYGNTESVSISEIADLEHLPPLLRILPPQAMKVALHNLPLETLTNSEVARLHALLLDEVKDILIRTVSLKTDPPVVEIFIKNENGGLVSVNSTIEVMRTMNKEKKCSVGTLNSDPSKSLNSQDDFVLKSPDLTDSDFQGVLVVLAAHPGNFIFQPLKYKTELKQLKGQMTAYYEAGAMPELTADRVSKNKLFAARHHADNLWYRVLVTEPPVGSRVPVRLIDHGDVTCVTISSLRELAPEFHVYPFMAVKGKLAGVMPRHKDWSVEDCIRFHNLVVGQFLAGMIVSIQDKNEDPMEMIVNLKLVNTNQEVDVDIAEVLVQEQRAVREL